MKKDSGRNINIEWLRIILTCMVITSHYINPQLGGALTAAEGSGNYYFLCLLAGLSACAVNVFILIFGYYNISNQLFNVQKVFKLLALTVLYRLVCCLLSFVFLESFEWKTVIYALIPVNYYVILYCVLLILSPFINRLINSFTKRQYLLFLTVLFCMFSVWEYLWDIGKAVMGVNLYGISTIGLYGDQEGYTIINFMILYLIGGFIRKYDISDKLKKYSGCAFLSCILLLSMFYKKIDLVIYYNNPVILMEAILIFLYFAYKKTNKTLIFRGGGIKGSIYCLRNLSTSSSGCILERILGVV